MATTTLPAFLRDRRERLRPGESRDGAAQARRRTPGLRREEVAARAGVSVTWYTWLEQGRGGLPSDDVLERLSRALELDDANREMLFLLAHDRPPPRRAAPAPTVTPALRRVLDGLSSPAVLKTPTFQIVAWNRAATAVLGDYGALPERERNLLRRAFAPGSERMVHQADEVRRACLAAFRVDIARAGATAEAEALIDELSASSADFRRLWSDGDVRSHGGFQKRLVREGVGEIVLESSLFQVDGGEGLAMLVLTPVDDASARAIDALVAATAPVR